MRNNIVQKRFIRMRNGSNKIHEDDAVDKNLVDLNMDSVEYNRVFYLMNAPSATKDFHRLKVRASPSPEVSFFCFQRDRNYVPGNECARFSIQKNIGNKDFSRLKNLIIQVVSIETTLQ